MRNTHSDFHRVATEFKTLWPIFKSEEIRVKEMYLPHANMTRQEMIDHYSPVIEECQPRCWRRHGRENIPLDWPHTLCTIYRVRCNLFHGGKDFSSEMDAKIVYLSFQVLARFINQSRFLE